VQRARTPGSTSGSTRIGAIRCGQRLGRLGEFLLSRAWDSGGRAHRLKPGRAPPTCVPSPRAGSPKQRRNVNAEQVSAALAHGHHAKTPNERSSAVILLAVPTSA